jgi:hypothetical protein
MKSHIKTLFRHLFREEMEQLDQLERVRKEINEEIRLSKIARDETAVHCKAVRDTLSHFDISVDVHRNSTRYARSWAVISLQGQKSDYIKFIDLGDQDIRDIATFLRQFERQSNIKIDATPEIRHAIRFNI